VCLALFADAAKFGAPSEAPAVCALTMTVNNINDNRSMSI
jgi:hypothetical protein